MTEEEMHLAAATLVAERYHTHRSTRVNKIGFEVYMDGLEKRFSADELTLIILEADRLEENNVVTPRVARVVIEEILGLEGTS